METARDRKRRPYPSTARQLLSRLPHRRTGRSGPGTQGGHRGIRGGARHWVHPLASTHGMARRASP
eukprot:5503097-Pyramimonas_sp.AAC.1